MLQYWASFTHAIVIMHRHHITAVAYDRLPIHVQAVNREDDPRLRTPVKSIAMDLHDKA